MFFKITLVGIIIALFIKAINNTFKINPRFSDIREKLAENLKNNPEPEPPGLWRR